MHEINEFCKERKITRKIQDAFIAYCKAHIHEAYSIGSNQTATGLLMKFTRSELEQKWQDFVLDLRDVLTQEQVT